MSTDVLIIGAGAAGMRAAVAAVEAGARVLVVANAPVGRGGSTFSDIAKGWGIQALVGEERMDDRLQAFYDDIVRAGLGRCDTRLARILVEESGNRVEDLISYGIRFRRSPHGAYFRAKGCFSTIERAFVTQDYENLQRTFQTICGRLPSDPIVGTALDLIVDQGQCRGAWILTRTGGLLRILAKAVILATGGGAGIYASHLVHNACAGDGYALAHRAGAQLVNMEFVQFMLCLKCRPTPIFLPVPMLGERGFLRTSEGKDLLDSAFDDPARRNAAVEARRKHFPFSCRDISGRIDIALAESIDRGNKVYWSEDVSSGSCSEVDHFAHAFNGGIKVDERSQSSLEGLFAAGEAGAGPHGADRIGGCMMTATQVFGERAGRFAAQRAAGLKGKAVPEAGVPVPPDLVWPFDRGETGGDIGQVERETRQLMDRCGRLRRNRKDLLRASELLTDYESQVHRIGEIGAAGVLDYCRARNHIITAKMVISGALAEEKSIGAHHREEHSTAMETGS